MQRLASLIPVCLLERRGHFARGRLGSGTLASSVGLSGPWPPTPWQQLHSY